MAAPGEFDLIERYFTRAIDDPDCRVGIGDDAAIVSPDGPLAVAVDTLVAGTHFPQGFAAHALGHRALAVNLSDLAAVGATPRWATLALTLPEANAAFLQQLATGFFALADRFGVALIGGDTTRGPLSITVQLMGLAPPQPLLRSGGRPGDRVFVTGTLGDSAAALEYLAAPPAALSADAAMLVARFCYPEPRVAFGIALAGIGAAAIDVSDGLLADLGHLCASSGCGADIDLDSVPLSTALRAVQAADSATTLALGGGDDYELCFALAPARVEAMLAAANRAETRVTEIGCLTARPGIRTLRGDQNVAVRAAGYTHF